MSDAATPEALRAAARSAAMAADRPSATSAYRELLQRLPDDTEALNYLAVASLASGDPVGARLLLEQAMLASPADATTRKNLGLALLHEKRADEAEAVLRPALVEYPDFHAARLYLGTALEQQGRRRDAVAAYLQALTGAQAGGEWVDSGTTPAALAPAVKHALHFVRDHYPAVLKALVDPLEHRHGTQAVARLRRCLAGYLGDRSVAPASPDQRPTFLFFPDLPSPPIFDGNLFPWHAELEARTPFLKTELLSILAEDAGLVPFLGEPPPGMKSEYLAGNAGRPQWDGFFFHRHGRRNDANCRRAPDTAAALDVAPIVRIPGHAPEALFSVLGAGSHILPHTGVTNTRVVTHLPLLVPGDCTLRVANQRHDWQEGHCVTFDDTFEHEAWNNSDRTRVVLLFDVWNPYLTDVECAGITELVRTIGDLKGDQL